MCTCILEFAEEDLKKTQASADGALGGLYIANYRIAKAITGDRKEAFDKYLVNAMYPNASFTG